jgi:hypothetical protein
MRKTPIPDIPVFGDASPRQNPLAQRAYRLSWRGLVPPIGVIFGPLAFAMGFIALRRYRANPKVQGYAQARTAIILGLLETPSHLMGLYCLARAFGWLGS